MGAQEKVTKVSQSFNVDKNVVIDLKTSHCNIIFDTWNKDEVAIEAFLESNELSKEELEQVAKGWRLNVDGSKDLVSITTDGSGNVYSYNGNYAIECSDEVERALTNLKLELAELPDMNFDFDFDFEDTHIADIPELPEMPELPELPEGVGAVKFDYGAYKKDGDKYLEKWSKKFESKYGKDYAKKMEEWGEKFGKEWGDKYAKEMEEWGEKFGEDMEEWSEEWGERFAEKMEAWAERFGEQMERQAEQIERQAEHAAKQREKHAKIREKVIEERVKVAEKRAEMRHKQAELRSKMAEKRAKKAALVRKLKTKTRHSHLKKTIIIKMPKKAKVKADVRHGELEFASVLDDVQADLSHTIFKAEGINGSNTSISAAYAPVYVANWNLGELNLNHVKKAELKTVEHVVLNCNSSNVKINNVLRSAIVDSNIGDVNILNVADTFTNLNFILQNNKVYAVLPDDLYNLNYKGKQSCVVHPNNANGQNCSSFSVSHPESNKTITINAKYSKVIME
ncbi:hypothetical protein MHTCC0001_05060 [Flavobacteriaceae bacterium MHTCC 0001]